MLLALTTAIVIGVVASTAEAAAATTARVRADGDCLRIRAEANTTSAVLGCLPDLSEVVLLGQQVRADGFLWERVRTPNAELNGWAAARYLDSSTITTTATTTLSPALPGGTPAAVAASPAVASAPEGGFAAIVLASGDLGALAAAQPYSVSTISIWDVQQQRFAVYVPGAPAAVNAAATQTATPGAVAFIRRAGTFTSGAPVPEPVAASRLGAAGSPSVLSTPAEGAMTAGASGTTDIAALIAAQPFSVAAVQLWEPQGQRWLTHIVGAPASVNSLTPGWLAPTSIVFLRRSPGTPATPAAATATTVTSAPAAPAASAGERVESYGLAEIMYYYCADGTHGDGGGFCGYMANGSRVHAGAASCAAAYMGQRFRIAGDPDRRIYTCEDTGGGVHRAMRDIWFYSGTEAAAWWRQIGPTAEILVLLD